MQQAESPLIRPDFVGPPSPASGRRKGVAPRTQRGILAALLSALLVWLALVATPAHADPTYPAFTGLVVDDAHVLPDADKAAITAKLRDLQTRTGIQFAVATVASLGGEEIEPYANALFRKWKIGQKAINNGLLLILAPKERKLRFEVGYGLEGTFTDVQSKLILHNTMVPKLKAGDPAGALKAGVDDAVTVLTKASTGAQGDQAASGNSTGSGASASDDSLDPTLMITLVIILFVVFIIFRAARSKRRWASGGFIGGTTGGWNSSDTSSSSSGGGGDSFSGGGGGDSGGGGASDSY